MAQRTSADGFEPDANGAGKDGFKDTGPNPTTVDAAWLNDIQENYCQFIESRGITLVPDDFTQLTDAIDFSFPASATDNRVCRFDGVTGKKIQESPVSISDAGAISGATDVSASGDFLYTTPKTRVVYVPAGGLTLPSSGAGASLWQTGSIRSITTIGGGQTAYARLNDYVPVGATVTKIRVLIDPATNGTLSTVTLLKRSVTGTTLNTDTTYGPWAGPTASGAVQWIDSGTVSIAIAASVWYELEIAMAAAAEIVNLLEITFTDVGPRND